MRRLLLGAMALLLVVGVTAMAGDNAYVGLKKCKMCHKGESKGMIFEKWQESAHANAYTALGEQPAIDMYAKLGKTGSPQEDAECLKCHVTAYGEDAALTEKILKEDGISCESCHGAGAGYWKKTVMQDHDAAVAAGMVADPKEGCTKCHNEESPAYEPFNYVERWAKIAHSLPE